VWYDEPGENHMIVDTPPITTVPKPSRVWDFWSGGKDSFQPDRDAAERVLGVYPAMPAIARANRAFLERSVRFLADERQIPQYVDLGCGLPVPPETHAVAQSVIPSARIAYVDHDPIVMSHARALLPSTREGACLYIEGDLTNPDTILPHLGSFLDFGRSVAIMLLSVLHFVPDDQLSAVVHAYMEPLPNGSAVVITHGTAESGTPEMLAQAEWNEAVKGHRLYLRTPEQLTALLADWTTLEPGLVPALDWRPQKTPTGRAAAALYAAVAVKT
jgi:hypothetical protein